MSNPDIPFVIWLDSDAFFTSFEKNKFDEFIEILETKSMILSGDMPPWEATFNAGSFIIKNDEIGKEIITKWIECYDRTKWSYNRHSGKWETPTEWAGDDYEQGAFIKYILNEYKDHIHKTEYYILNNVFPEYLDKSIIAHLAGYYKFNRQLVDILKR
jgi:hypothetical protein